jgi:hypothetical protein
MIPLRGLKERLPMNQRELRQWQSKKKELLKEVNGS